MPDGSSQILLKIITNRRLQKEEQSFFLQNFNLFLRKASENRVEFIFLKALKRSYANLFNSPGIKEAYKYGEAKSLLLNKTAAFFSKYLDDRDYVVFKTYYPFPAIVSDIDILFFDKAGYKKFVDRLIKKDFDYKRDDELKGSLQKPGLMKCEPHNDISWHGMCFVSKEFIRKNLTTKRIGQFTLTVPNSRATFVIGAAHILFDCQYLSLRDFLFLRKFTKDRSIIKVCKAEAEKFGWRRGAEYFIDILSSKKEFSFPIWIPVTRAYSFFKEKIIFDFKERNENHFMLESILLPFIYYHWKKIRSKFSKRIYRNSWLY